MTFRRYSSTNRSLKYLYQVKSNLFRPLRLYRFILSVLNHKEVQDYQSKTAFRGKPIFVSRLQSARARKNQKDELRLNDRRENYRETVHELFDNDYAMRTGIPFSELWKAYWHHITSNRWEIAKQLSSNQFITISAERRELYCHQCLSWNIPKISCQDSIE